MSDDLIYEINEVYNACVIKYKKKLSDNTLEKFKINIITYFSTLYNLKHLFIKRVKYDNIKDYFDKKYYMSVFYDKNYKCFCINHKYIGSTFLVKLGILILYNQVIEDKCNPISHKLHTGVLSMLKSCVTIPKNFYQIKTNDFIKHRYTTPRCFYEKIKIKEKSRYTTINHVLKHIYNNITENNLKCWIPVGYESSVKNVNNIGILPFIHKRGYNDKETKQAVLSNSHYVVSTNLGTKIIGKIKPSFYSNISNKIRNNVDVVLSMMSTTSSSKEESNEVKNIDTILQSFMYFTESYLFYIYIGLVDDICHITYKIAYEDFNFDNFIKNKNIKEVTNKDIFI